MWSVILLSCGHFEFIAFFLVICVHRPPHIFCACALALFFRRGKNFAQSNAVSEIRDWARLVCIMSCVSIYHWAFHSPICHKVEHVSHCWSHISTLIMLFIRWLCDSFKQSACQVKFISGLILCNYTRTSKRSLPYSFSLASVPSHTHTHKHAHRHYIKV